MPSETAERILPRWSWRWWRCAPGEAPTLVWIILLHACSIIGLLTLPAPSLGVVMVALTLLVLGGLGTTVGYHRALAHRSVILREPVTQFLIFVAVINGSGNPTSWVRMHRWHHAKSDQPEDISSPTTGGFWWAHMRWLWQADSRPCLRCAPDLEIPRYQWWSRAQIPLLALTFFGGLAWPAHGLHLLTAWLWIGPLRLLWALHVQCTVNSLCHTGIPASDRGSSRNIWWLAIFHLGQGENWHANHHARAANPRLGHGWQLDLGWWTIFALLRLRLARKRASAGIILPAAESDGQPR